jgi:hypothetical protein
MHPRIVFLVAALALAPLEVHAQGTPAPAAAEPSPEVRQAIQEIRAGIQQGNADAVIRQLSSQIATQPAVARLLASEAAAAAVAAGQADRLANMVQQAAANLMRASGAGANVVVSALVAGVAQGASGGLSGAALKQLVDRVVLASDAAIDLVTGGAAGAGDDVKIEVRAAVAQAVDIPVAEQPPIQRQLAQERAVTFEPPARSNGNPSPN